MLKLMCSSTNLHSHHKVTWNYQGDGGLLSQVSKRFTKILGTPGQLGIAKGEEGGGVEEEVGLTKNPYMGGVDVFWNSTNKILIANFTLFPHNTLTLQKKYFVAAF